MKSRQTISFIEISIEAGILLAGSVGSPTGSDSRGPGAAYGEADLAEGSGVGNGEETHLPAPPAAAPCSGGVRARYEPGSPSPAPSPARLGPSPRPGAVAASRKAAASAGGGGADSEGAAGDGVAASASRGGGEF